MYRFQNIFFFRKKGPEGFWLIEPFSGGRMELFNTFRIFFTVIFLLNCHAQIVGSGEIETDPGFTYSDQKFDRVSPRKVVKRLKNATTPDEKNDLAVAWLKLGRSDRAGRILFQLYRDQTASLETLLNFVRLQSMLGEEEHAEQICRNILARKLIPGRELFSFRDTLFRNGREREAVALMRAVSKGKSANVSRAHLWLAEHARTHGDNGSALRHYDRVLEADPASKEALVASGYIYFAGGDWIRARDYFRAAKKFGSDEPDLPFLLAASLFQSGELEEALDVLKRVPVRAMNRETVLLYGKLQMVFDYDAPLDRFLAQTSLSKGEKEGVLAEWYDLETGDEAGRSSKKRGRVLKALPVIFPEFQKLY